MKTLTTILILFRLQSFSQSLYNSEKFNDDIEIRNDSIISKEISFEIDSWNMNGKDKDNCVEEFNSSRYKFVLFRENGYIVYSKIVKL